MIHWPVFTPPGSEDKHRQRTNIHSEQTKKVVRAMKSFLFPVLLVAILAVGCAHSPAPTSSLTPSAASFQTQQVTVASNAEQIPLKFPEMSVKSKSEDVDDEEDFDDVEDGDEEEMAEVADPPESLKSSPEIPAKSGNESADNKENSADEEKGEEKGIATIPDPLEPFNRAMYHFNDKLYFWALKPVAQGYNKVAPERARVSVKNFFTNLRFPIRFLSYLLQADFSGAAAEFGRFAVNTIWGVGGLLDPSSSQQLNLPKGDADLGQTLGVYGVGQGFYLVWPILGPSSARDSVEIAGEYFLYPVSYISPWYDWLGVRAYEEVNDASLRIGDYESLKEAAIDPYVALRDAYGQYRQKKVEAGRGKPQPPKPGGLK
ncbi:MAG: VacJ family lipoprotein [Thermodesulfobacteriota bacterium]